MAKAAYLSHSLAQTSQKLCSDFFRGKTLAVIFSAIARAAFVLVCQDLFKTFCDWIDSEGIQDPDSCAEAYWVWLQKCLPSKTEHKTEVPLHKLAGSPAAGVGWRSVSKYTVKSKVRSFLSEEKWLGPPVTLRHLPVADKFHFVNGHQRACSLHQFFYMCFKLELEPPHPISALGACIPVETITELTAGEAALEGLKLSINQQFGSTPLTPYNLLELMAKQGWQAETFALKVKEKIPQWSSCADIFPWSRMRDLSNRVSPVAVKACAELCSKLHACAVPVEWFRDPTVLLAPQRSVTSAKDNLTICQQELWVQRLIVEVEKAVSSKVDISNEFQCRKMAAGIAVQACPPAKRQQWRAMAVTFSSAMRFKEWRADEAASLKMAFATGSCDTSVQHAPSAPQTWHCVRQILQKRKQDLEKDELAKTRAEMDELAAKASAAQDAISLSAASQVEVASKMWRLRASEHWKLWHSKAEALVLESEEQIGAHLSRQKEMQEQQAGSQALHAWVVSAQHVTQFMPAHINSITSWANLPLLLFADLSGFFLSIPAFRFIQCLSKNQQSQYNPCRWRQTTR